jgi:anti-sigma B factor antagonist
MFRWFALIVGPIPFIYRVRALRRTALGRAVESESGVPLPCVPSVQYRTARIQGVGYRSDAGRFLAVLRRRRTAMTRIPRSIQEGFMSMSERMVGAITLLDLDGQLTLGSSAEGLRDKVRSLLQQGQQQFIVNLAAVPYMDSCGLGELVQAYATVTRQGGALKLLHLTSRLRDLLVITKLATVFDCYDSEDEALASFPVPA